MLVRLASEVASRTRHANPNTTSLSRRRLRRENLLLFRPPSRTVLAQGGSGHVGDAPMGFGAKQRACPTGLHWTGKSNLPSPHVSRKTHPISSIPGPGRELRGEEGKRRRKEKKNKVEKNKAEIDGVEFKILFWLGFQRHILLCDSLCRLCRNFRAVCELSRREA